LDILLLMVIENTKMILYLFNVSFGLISGKVVVNSSKLVCQELYEITSVVETSLPPEGLLFKK